MTEAELKARLRVRYDREWIFMTNVRDSTGYPRGKRRYADAMAMNMYPSRGLYLDGFEIKLNRSDLVAELRDPSKAEAFKQFCDHWWLVIPDKDIIRLGGVPDDWGVLWAPPRGGMRVIKQAPKLEPVPITRGFLASLLRNAGK